MKKALKNYFKKNYKELIRYLNHRNSGLIKLYYRKFWTPRAGSIAEILQTYSHSKGEVYFLQVGANDGMEQDPILKFIKKDGWKGTMIEPQEYVFEKLEYLHKNTPGIKLIKAALSYENEIRPLYKISFSNSRWATGISSFIRETLVEQIESGYVDECARKEGIDTPVKKDDYIDTDMVTCINFEELAKDLDLRKVDILQIDTEGFDAEIIKMINFHLLNPDIISFEISHSTEMTKSDIYNLLHLYHYKIYEKGRDAIAVKESQVVDIKELDKYKWV